MGMLFVYKKKKSVCIMSNSVQIERVTYLNRGKHAFEKKK